MGEAPTEEGFRILARGSGYPQPWLGLQGRAWRGHMLAAIDRLTHWQMGYFLRSKEHYQELHADGLDAFRRLVVELEPRFAPHLEHLTDWHPVYSRASYWQSEGPLRAT